MNIYGYKFETLTLTASGASGETEPFRSNELNFGTVNFSISGIGAPTFSLYATNDVTKSAWVALETSVAADSYLYFGGPTRTFQFYKFAHTGGDSGDTVSYHIHRCRSQ